MCFLVIQNSRVFILCPSAYKANILEYKSGQLQISEVQCFKKFMSFITIRKCV